MLLISQLCAEHRALEAYAARLLEIVAAPVPDTAAVAAMRWGMAQALLEHCAHEDRAIYDVLRNSGDADAIALAERYLDQHGALATSFAAYIASWPVGRMAREWTIFRNESQALLGALAARIEHEEAVLYAHAESMIVIRAAA